MRILTFHKNETFLISVRAGLSVYIEAFDLRSFRTENWANISFLRQIQNVTIHKVRSKKSIAIPVTRLGGL
jgi:hypothetical protein